MDLLALIAADPTLAPLWAILVFAAGMYPVGMLFQCSSCCNTCDLCEEGTLPETVTVTLDGFTDKTQGPDLCLLQFSSCFGSGAAGKVTAPGGDPEADKGPITAVSLTNGGSGYARLGRVAPTLTATGSGEGATFTVTVEAAEDACGIDFWKVSKVTASGGTGYTDGEQLTITVAEGDTAEQEAVVTIATTRSDPDLTVSVTSAAGSGAEFTVATSPRPGTPETWEAASVTVVNGGSGYADGETVTVTGSSGRDVTVDAATGYIKTVRVTPTISLYINSATGSDAVLEATLATGTGSSSGRPVWIVDSITITDGGSGYEAGQYVYVSVDDGTEDSGSWFEATIDEVDEDGAILSVAIVSGGEYYKDSGEIEEVVLDQYGFYYGGSYYHDDGVAAAATVVSGGVYYREDEEQPPYVADVTVTIDQEEPSDGAGAEITAAVDDDPDSPDFGKIVSLTIDASGDDYLAWQWRNTKCCGDFYNGMSVVLQKSQANQCVYEHLMCGVGNLRYRSGRIRVEYRGPSLPPTVSVTSEINVQESVGSSVCNVIATSETNVTNCSSMSFNAVSPTGVTASVTSGGTYDATFLNPGGRSCFICCKGDSLLPSEVEIDVTDNNNTGRGGVYVASFIGLLSGSHNILWGGFQSGTQQGDPVVQLMLCALQSQSGFDADPVCGDNCHKKCRIQVDWQAQNNDRYWSNPPAPTVPEECDCLETPICGPYGTFTLCSQINPANCPYEVVVRAPL